MQKRRNGDADFSLTEARRIASDTEHGIDAGCGGGAEKKTESVE